jgi:hypothetical protein
MGLDLRSCADLARLVLDEAVHHLQGAAVDTTNCEDGYGEVLIARIQHDHPTGRDSIRIDRADPRARIAVELLDEIRANPSDWARLDRDVLTLADDHGQRFIYRIRPDSYDPNSRSYLMEWPD